MGAANNIKFTLTKRQKLLFPVIMCGAFFEGFDFMVVNLALPFITRDMGIDTKYAGLTLSTIAIGTLVAFFIVRLGDRIGRKPVFMWSVVLYSALSLLTAFTPNIQYFIGCQFLARIFLVTVWATGYIVIAEEFSVEMRGRALGLFQAAAAIGAIFPSLFMPLLASTGLGWRGLYVIGALPILVILFLGKNFHETERFKSAKLANDSGPGFFAVFQPQYRKYILIVSAIWVSIYLCYTSSMSFFSYRVVNDLGWDEGKVGLTTAVAYLVGLTGYYVAGKMLDSIGRKPTAAIFFLCGSAGTICAFQTTQYAWVLMSLIFGTFFVGVFTVIGASFTNELFPTAIRANATAWGNNIIGRLGQVLAPALVGFLSLPLGGVGNAVSLLALAPIAGAALVLIFLPETRNRELQDFIGGDDPSVKI
ncbi:MAG: MFS transporter [Desulfocucumaceae bacterium]